jgi:hypothetical protein
MAVWALAKLLPAGALTKLAGQHQAAETDTDVAAEWHAAMT